MSVWVPDDYGLNQTVARNRRLLVMRMPSGNAVISLTEDGQVPLVITLDPDAVAFVVRRLTGDAP